MYFIFDYISDHAIREREKWNERLDEVWQERDTSRQTVAKVPEF
jgi:hypothetical protein